MKRTRSRGHLELIDHDKEVKCYAQQNEAQFTALKAEQ